MTEKAICKVHAYMTPTVHSGIFWNNNHEKKQSVTYGNIWKDEIYKGMKRNDIDFHAH